MGLVFLLATLATPFFLLYLYIRINDAKLLHLPPDIVHSFSPERYTEETVKETFSRLQSRPITVHDSLPPKTGRRYIVTGGVRMSPICGYL
jgi:hypothetical protein